MRQMLAAERRAVLEGVDTQRIQTLEYVTAERLAVLASVPEERLAVLAALHQERIKTPDGLGRGARPARILAHPRASQRHCLGLYGSAVAVERPSRPASAGTLPGIRAGSSSIRRKALAVGRQSPFVAHPQGALTGALR